MRKFGLFAAFVLLLTLPASADDLLKRGSRGEAVAELQAQLRAWNLPVDPDGVFGPRTETAIRAFQRENFLPVDGVVGPRTRAVLAFNLRVGGPSFGPLGGSANIGIGHKALQQQLQANNTIAIGTVAAQYAVALADSTIAGVKAARFMREGTGATAYGFRALEHSAKAGNNTAIGDSALWHSQGTGNTVGGYVAAEGMSRGDENVIFGRAAARYRDNGDHLILIGNRAGAITSNADRTNLIDANPEDDVGGAIAGDRLVGIGHQALEEFLGSDVLAAGHRAGRSLIGEAGAPLRSVFLGPDAGHTERQKPDAANSTAVGADSWTDANNQISLGNEDVLQVRTWGVFTFSRAYPASGEGVPPGSLFKGDDGKLRFKADDGSVVSFSGE
ncbi:hypothetical protein FQ775_03035 [Nitratireductor mangrovi]|uniref:Peptidoglycan binding-like domain-containing protein n=1 Tax=Nitratireductor mangrovi TaxID=2599600 RepID=A0A5B8KV19_9HYPH|nr:peptidoglycan-binding protein [Nitratireductor mangrovi]QDY99430.1 hypothetical protein FQ775_03035 [Nitratireductor mangrovi]